MATAAIHAHLAGADGRPGINETVAFRAQASVAVLAAVAMLVRPRRWSAMAGTLVGLGSLAAVFVYSTVDVGAVGPLADLYEPTWDGLKEASAALDFIAVIASALSIGRRTHTSLTPTVRQHADRPTHPLEHAR